MTSSRRSSRRFGASIGYRTTVPSACRLTQLLGKTASGHTGASRSGATDTSMPAARRRRSSRSNSSRARSLARAPVAVRPAGIDCSRASRHSSRSALAAPSGPSRLPVRRPGAGGGEGGPGGGPHARGDEVARIGNEEASSRFESDGERRGCETISVGGDGNELSGGTSNTPPSTGKRRKGGPERAEGASCVPWIVARRAYRLAGGGRGARPCSLGVGGRDGVSGAREQRGAGPPAGEGGGQARWRRCEARWCVVRWKRDFARRGGTRGAPPVGREIGVGEGGEGGRGARGRLVGVWGGGGEAGPGVFGAP